MYSRDVQNGFSQDDLEVLAGITGQAGKAVEQAALLASHREEHF